MRTVKAGKAASSETSREVDAGGEWNVARARIYTGRDTKPRTARVPLYTFFKSVAHAYYTLTVSVQVTRQPRGTRR